MIVDEQGYVCTKKDSVKVRSEANRNAEVIIQLIAGAEFTVIDGPQCANNWSWWKIKTEDGTTGWMAEGGDETDPYFICPMP